MLETRPNGGTAVFLRAAWIAGVIYIIGLILRNWIDPSRSFRFSFTELRLQLLGSFRWFGTIFAGAYAALYARFASQWSYLASVYNQIKATECRGDTNKPLALAQWKAAFIDDAVSLHLAAKPSFKGVVLHWYGDDSVKAAVEEHIQEKIKKLEAAS
jgi:hypothetical protein